MFSGIVIDTTAVLKSEKKDKSLFLVLHKPKDAGLKIGSSVSLSGVCTTVQKIGVRDFTVELTPETLKKTSFGKVVPSSVNIEMALKIGDTVDGHFVLGHVDTVGKIKTIQKDGRARMMTFSYGPQFNSLVALGGSITVDGVGLTIAARAQNSCTVSLVSYTTNHTTFKIKKAGAPVNIEFDVIAKYATHYVGNDVASAA